MGGGRGASTSDVERPTAIFDLRVALRRHAKYSPDSASGGRRRFHYRCYVNRRKGDACCTNRQPEAMAVADVAVVNEVAAVLLNPAIVTRTLDHAVARILADRSAEQREQLEAELADCEAALRRLTAAIAAGGELSSLLGALATYEARKRELAARLDAARAPKPAVDVRDVRARLTGYLGDGTSCCGTTSTSRGRSCGGSSWGGSRSRRTPTGTTGLPGRARSSRSSRASYVIWRPQRDSNPCFGLERATSWASGRWGLKGSNPRSYYELQPDRAGGYQRARSATPDRTLTPSATIRSCGTTETCRASAMSASSPTSAVAP